MYVEKKKKKQRTMVEDLKRRQIKHRHVLTAESQRGLRF